MSKNRKNKKILVTEIKENLNPKLFEDTAKIINKKVPEMMKEKKTKPKKKGKQNTNSTTKS
jgi:hypothetical protein